MSSLFHQLVCIQDGVRIALSFVTAPSYAQNIDTTGRTSHDSHCNLRYLSFLKLNTLTGIIPFKNVIKEQVKKLEKEKRAFKLNEIEGVTLSPQDAEDVQTVMASNSDKIVVDFAEDSFPRNGNNSLNIIL